MSWTTPRTWSAGELVTVGMFNQQIRDNMDHLKTSIDDSGKIRALSSTYLADLSGANLTGVSKLAAANAYTEAGAVHNFGWGTSGRLVTPYGTNKWAT